MSVPVNLNPDRRTLQQFGWLCLVIFGAIAVAGFVKSGLNAFSIVWAVSGALGGLLGWLRPQWLKWIFVTWIILVFPIGWVMSKVLLAAMYFGVFTPIGMILRMAGKDPLRLKRPPGDSYWQTRPVRADLRRYFRQY